MTTLQNPYTKKETPQEKAKRLQEEAQKREIEQQKQKKTTVVRNPLFDRMSEEEKKKNAEYLNSNDPRGISHLIEIDTTSDRDPMKKLTGEERYQQYQESFQKSPYTQENIYRNTQNRKKETEILSDEEIKEQGLLEGRAYARYPNVDPLTGNLIQKDGTVKERQYGDLTPITLNSSTTDKSKSGNWNTSNSSPSGEIYTGEVKFRGADGKLYTKGDEAQRRYQDSMNGKIATQKQELDTKLKEIYEPLDTERKRYIERNMTAITTSDPKYQELNKKTEETKQNLERLRFLEKYMGAKMDNLEANEFRNGESIEYYYQQHGLTPEEVKEGLAKYGSEGISNYHWRKYGSKWIHEADQEYREAQKQQEDYTSNLEKKFEQEYIDANKDKFNDVKKTEEEIRKENDQKYSGMLSEDAQKLEEIRKNEMKAREEMQNTIGSSQYKGEKGMIKKVLDQYKDFETAGDIVRDQLADRQKKEIEEHKKVMKERREELLKQYQNIASQSQTKEAGAEYLRQKEAMIADAEAKALQKIMDRHEEEKTDLDDRMLNDPSFTEYKKLEDKIAEKRIKELEGGGKTETEKIDLNDLIEEEKYNFITEFAKTDDGDPNTVVSRAIKAYENAIKIPEDEKGEAFSTELELGRELDRRLQLYAFKEQGGELTPDEMKEALEPVQALEWLLSNGANSTVANGMLRNRGITADTLKKAQETYWKNTFGLSDEEVNELFEKKGTQSMKARYEAGDLTPEEEEAYFARLRRYEEETKGKTASTSTKTSKSSKSSKSTGEDNTEISGTSESQIKADKEERSDYSRLRDQVIGLVRMGKLNASQVKDYVFENGGEDLYKYEKEAIIDYAIDYDRSLGSYVESQNVGEFDDSPESQGKADEYLQRMEEIKGFEEEGLPVVDMEGGTFVDGVQVGKNRDPRLDGIIKEFNGLEDDKERALYLMELEATDKTLAGMLIKILEQQGKKKEKEVSPWLTFTKFKKQNPPKKKSNNNEEDFNEDEFADEFLSQFD